MHLDRFASRLTALSCLLAVLGIAASDASASASGPPTGTSSAGRAGGVLLVLGAHGHLRREWDPYLPAASATSLIAAPPVSALRSTRSSRKGPTVTASLAALGRSGAITPLEQASATSIYNAASHTLARLTGTRRSELGAVLANVRAIAASGGLTADRVQALMLTLQQNRTWWSSGPLLAADARVSFPGSKLVWEYYPGQGIEIQWLGTFGQANAYYTAHDNADLQALLDQALPLASTRGGGLTWEYEFRFDGGSPPWTSGLSQGTGVQVLARAGVRLGQPALIADAHRALAIFTVPAPVGVAIPMSAGTWFAEYTYAPSDRIINGFIQALDGLYDDAMLTGDPLAAELFQSGDAEARLATPTFDTGAWSLYDQYGESDLSYHELLQTFLQNLCQRVNSGGVVPPELPPIATAGPPAEPAPVTTAPPSAVAAQTGGTTPTAPTGSTALADQVADQIYCTTAANFKADLKTPPVLSVLTTAMTGGRTGSIRYQLSKLSTVTLSVRSGGRLLHRSQQRIGYGTRSFAWTPPKGGGTFAVTVAATDLAGNTGQGHGTISVAPAPAHAPHAPKKPKTPATPIAPSTGTSASGSSGADG